MWKWWTLIWIIVAGAAPGNLAVAAEQGTEGYDSALRRAEAFVDRSDRYLHQSKLRRGMSGYGLTVMAGTKIEKFQATVVSILGNFSGPRRDVVLCKLSGLGLAESGIITGMSGSPVFIQDPADGKHKMIGAVAYAWSFQKDPICGVQPIAQMLALEGVPLPGAGKAAAGIAAARPKAGIDEDLARTLLRPAKIDFSTAALPRRFRPVADARPGTPRLLALSTPVMVAGAGRRAMALAEKVFSGTTLAPIRTGTVASAEARAAADAKLQPGMAISVPLVSGDADWAAVGTVTEVIGDYVLALGHSFYAEGPVELPMGPAYVHTVVPSAYRSFKLGSTLRVTGALTQDEYTAVAGRVGQTARMVPMTVTVHWAGSRQNFQYKILRHRWLSAVTASLLVADSVYSYRDLPERHTLEYAVEVEFEQLGKYRADNRTSTSYEMPARSDLTRPLAAMMNTPLGKPVFPKRIDVTVTVRKQQTTATILALELDRNVYKPGQDVKGKVTLRPFRSGRVSKDVSIRLPEDLPDGQYALTVSNGMGALTALQKEMPHRFTPRTVEQLLEAVREVARPRMDHLYVHLPLGHGGLAVKKNELEHLPASLAEILVQAAPVDSKPYQRSKVVDFPSEYVLAGSAQASFTVEKRPRRGR